MFSFSLVPFSGGGNHHYHFYFYLLEVLVMRLRVLSICLLVAFLITSFIGLPSAYADDSADFVGSDYALDSWDNAPKDLVALAEAYIADCKGYLKEISDIPTAWVKLVGDMFALSPLSGVFYYIDNGSLTRHTNSHGGGGGHHRTGTETVTDGDLEIPPESFKESITEANKTITPKNQFQSKLSYRIDLYWYEDKAPSSSLRFTVYDGSGFCPEHYERTNGVYLLPFYEDGKGMKYFAYYQYHLYFEPGTDDNEGKCRVRADIIGLDYAGKSDVVADSSFWWFDPSVNHVFGNTYSTWTDLNPYFDIGLPFSDKPYLPVSGYINFSDYISRSGSVWSQCCTPSNANNVPIGNDSSFKNWISYDKSSTFDFTTVFNSFLCPRSDHTSLNDDIGYIVSSDPIVTQYVDIDTGKIPDNQIITISGDTIYDYSITNPDTGKSTTINKYITNNYTYPTKPDDDNSCSSGGGVGGNVTVGGNVNVGGEVGINGSVDININISGGGNGGGTAGDLISGVDSALATYDTDFDAYYDDALEKSDGFRQFMGKFFDFVPAPIVALLGLGLVVAIICRILGR